MGIERALTYSVVAYRMTVLFADVAIFLARSVNVYLNLLFRAFVPKRERSINGDIALITGAGHGLGRQLAIDLAKLGAIVVCLDIMEENNNETVRIINDLGGVAFGYECDVSNCESVQATAKIIRRDVGDVNILINNAGVLVCQPFMSTSSKDIKRVTNTNFLGQLWVLRCFLPQMVEMNQGTVVAIISLSGHAGAPNMVPYTATQFAVRGMMEALYIELRQENRNHNIHLMTVSPLIIDTGMVKAPRIRFPGIIDIVTPEEASSIIISNMRRRAAIIFIPGILFYLQILVRFLPSRIQLLITDFIDTGIDIHYESF